MDVSGVSLSCYEQCSWLSMQVTGGLLWPGGKARQDRDMTVEGEQRQRWNFDCIRTVAGVQRVHERSRRRRACTCTCTRRPARMYTSARPSFHFARMRLATTHATFISTRSMFLVAAICMKSHVTKRLPKWPAYLYLWPLGLLFMPSMMPGHAGLRGSFLGGCEASFLLSWPTACS